MRPEHNRKQLTGKSIHERATAAGTILGKRWLPTRERALFKIVLSILCAGIIVTAFIFLANPGRVETRPIQITILKKDINADVDLFYDYISGEIRNTTGLAKDRVENRANTLAWRWAYAAEATLIAYDNTKQMRFLDLFIENFEQVLDIRDSELGIYDDFKGRIVNSWGSGIVEEGKWIAHVTTAGRVTYPATQFIRIVSDEGLQNYQHSANKYLDIVIQIMKEFEEDYQPVPGTDYKYYFRPTTDGLEPINHVNAVGSTFVNLYAITGEEKYRNRVEEISRVFMDNIYVEPNGSYSWKYLPKEPVPQDQDLSSLACAIFNVCSLRHAASEPLWKSQISAPLALYAYNEGIFFTEADVRMFANTLKKNIIVGDEVNNFISLRNYKTVTKDSPEVSGIAGWMSYDSFDPEVGDMIVNIVTKRPDIFEGGWLANPNIARGYAYLLKYETHEASADK